MTFYSDAIIVLWLFLSLAWNLPSDSFAKRCIGMVKPVILWSGLWHSWSMFAPSPIKVERRLSIVLSMVDGSTETHELFKIHEVGKLRAFLSVRERKFQAVLAQKDSNTQRAAICAHGAKKLASDPENVAKSQLLIKKRRIKSPTETEDHEVEENVVWTINYTGD